MKRLVGAFQFLTIVPLRFEGAPAGESALFFPLVGALLGAAGAQLFVFFDVLLGPALGSLLVVAFWYWIGGGLHEDGVADVADALRPQRSRARMMEILKDSRIGAFGAMTLILVVAVRWQAIQRMPTHPLYELIACFALARAAMVAMAWTTRPVGDGLGLAFSGALTTRIAVIAMAMGVGLSFAGGWRLALLLIPGAVLVVWMLREWFEAKLGGVNGDCLGATCLLTETALMVIASCRNCLS